MLLPMSEHSLHFSRQAFEIIGFLEKAVAAPVEDLLRLSFDAVPAGEKDADLRIDLPEQVEGLAARQARHDHVQDHQGDLFLIFRINVQGLPAARRGINLISKRLELPAVDLQDRRLVVDQENRPLPFTFFRCGGNGILLDGRQIISNVVPRPSALFTSIIP